eukprot:351893-Chlamydomonas_euryale.AAC.11
MDVQATGNKHLKCLPCELVSLVKATMLGSRKTIAPQRNMSSEKQARSCMTTCNMQDPSGWHVCARMHNYTVYVHPDWSDLSCMSRQRRKGGMIRSDIDAFLWHTQTCCCSVVGCVRMLLPTGAQLAWHVSPGNANRHIRASLFFRRFAAYVHYPDDDSYEELDLKELIKLKHIAISECAENAQPAWGACGGLHWLQIG